MSLDLLTTVSGLLSAITDEIGPGSEVLMCDDGRIVAVAQGARVVAEVKADEVPLEQRLWTVLQLARMRGAA